MPRPGERIVTKTQKIPRFPIPSGCPAWDRTPPRYCRTNPHARRILVDVKVPSIICGSDGRTTQSRVSSVMIPKRTTRSHRCPLPILHPPSVSHDLPLPPVRRGGARREAGRPMRGSTENPMWSSIMRRVHFWSGPSGPPVGPAGRVPYEPLKPSTDPVWNSPTPPSYSRLHAPTRQNLNPNPLSIPWHHPSLIPSMLHRQNLNPLLIPWHHPSRSYCR